jgi:hypothetical protein
MVHMTAANGSPPAELSMDRPFGITSKVHAACFCFQTLIFRLSIRARSTGTTRSCPERVRISAYVRHSLTIRVLFSSSQS